MVWCVMGSGDGGVEGWVCVLVSRDGRGASRVRTGRWVGCLGRSGRVEGPRVQVSQLL